MAKTKRMGFEGKIYYGAQGSTAATEITNSRDITESFGTGKGETTTRGDGSAPPIETFQVTSRTYSIKWQMTEKSDDTTLAALKAAAVAGTPVAIRTKSYSSGTGIDMDVILEVENGKPYKGEATLDFTGTPNDDNRTPQFNV